MTGVAPPLAHGDDGVTILMGYEPGLKVFAGFDLDRHINFSKGSPSVQVDVNVLRQALQDGLSFDRKSNDEVSVGIRPDQFINYVVNADSLHRLGRSSAVFKLLRRAATLEKIPEEMIRELAEPRRRIVRTVGLLSREANFRGQVLSAYEHRCAVTRAQLRLVEAAHVLPVGAPRSVDDVRNGLALSPTYHRAYDAGLIYLTEDLTMKANPRKVAELCTLKLDAGLPDFERQLGKIFLPQDRRQWPNPSYIREANRFRGIFA